MTTDSPPFHIDETHPTPLVRDFDVFLNAMEDSSVYLTKSNRFLDRATLHRLNQEMQTHREDTQARADQPVYLLLNLFQRFCLDTRLYVIGRRAGKPRMVATEAVDVFEALSPVERFMALLEGLWVDCDWAQLCGQNAGWLQAQPGAMLDYVSEQRPGRKVRLSSHAQRDRLYGRPGQHYVLRVLSLFGFLGYTLISEAEAKQLSLGPRILLLDSFTTTTLGVHFLNVLHKARPFPFWNLAERRRLRIPTKFPGQTIEAYELEPDESGQHGLEKPEPFHEAFLPLLPLRSVQRGLPRATIKHRSGTFVFKVSLGGRVSRTIACSGRHTLHTLHRAIQEAFAFDDDHLYCFFMDERISASGETYNDSRGRQPPFADEIRLGELDLWDKRQIKYLFDFGDHWEFNVTVMEYREAKHNGSPKILASHGTSPDQYPS